MALHQFLIRPTDPAPWSDPDLLASTGAGPVLADDSDATFVTSHFDEDPDDPRFGIWAAALEPALPSWILDLPGTGVFTSARANHEGDPDESPPMFLRLGTSVDGPNLSAGIDALLTTTIADYNDTLFDGVQVDFSTLVDGTAVVFFGSGLSDGTAFGPAENLYEFVITVLYETPDLVMPPPLRRWPVSNGATGPVRHWPPTEARRQAGGYH